MKSPLSEKVQYAFNVISKFLNVDIESRLKEEPNGIHKVNLGTYGKEKQLFEVYCLIQQEDYHPAYQKCADLVNEILGDIRIRFKTPSELEELGYDLVKFASILKDFNEYFADESIKLKNYLFSNKWLREDEKVDDLVKHFNWNWINDARNSIKKGFVKTYVTTGNPNIIPETVRYVVSDAIVITDSQIPLHSKPTEDDLVHVSIFMKIENIIDYSFFIIRFQYHDTCVIATDKMKFVNPRVATCSRNPSRRREEYYENVDLPYYIIDDIIKWRKDSKAITKEPGQETYIKQITKYLHPAAKICLRLLIEELVPNLRFTQTQERIGYAGETIKLLASSNIQSTESKFSKCNYKACEQFAKELVLPTTNALVVKSKSELLAKHGSPTSLLTLSESASLGEWLEHESVREQKQTQLDEYSKTNTTPDRKKLQLMFHENFENIAEILFSGDEVFAYLIDAPVYTPTFASSGVDNIQCICAGVTDSKEGIPMCTVHANTSDDKSIYDYFRCINHDETRARVKLSLRIQTWKQLVCLLSVKREELPFTFQNYNVHHWTPYYGNPIIDNVNPEFLVKDYLSQYYSNGFSIGFYLCRNCVNAYYKQHKKFKRSLVLMSYIHNCVVDIVDYDIFIKENAHLFNGKRLVQIC